MKSSLAEEWRRERQGTRGVRKQTDVTVVLRGARTLAISGGKEGRGRLERRVRIDGSKERGTWDEGIGVATTLRCSLLLIMVR